MATICRSEDQSVKVLGPDGGLRRRRFSQADARALEARRVVLAKWNRDETRILFVQFYGDRECPAKPQRWHKTGTRYSYPEVIAGEKCWTHKSLPYRAMDAQLGYTEAPPVIDAHIRALFLAVPLSIAAGQQNKKRANVVSIATGRKRPAKTTRAIAFPGKQAA